MFFFCVFDCDFFVSFQLTTPRLLRFSCLDLTPKKSQKTFPLFCVMSLLDFSSQPWVCKSFMLWILDKKSSKNCVWLVWVYSCIFRCIWGIMNWWEMLFLLKIAFLAQLVEQWTLNPWVAGSSPAGGILKKALHVGVEPFLLYFCQIFAKTTHNFLDFIIACV